ncbi:MAG: sulfatase-like hydrolase/transferase [Thermoplasmata archaeon]|nr:sulfatase-like hydrolase/transferase [Thermoplasmata archaeon]
MSESPPGAAGGLPPPSGTNIVVVVLDCARAKSLPALGGTEGPVTPVLAELARRGTVFPRAVATANWTIPSHASLFSGVYPNVHGVRTFERGAAPRETVAAWLRRRGYSTAMFTEMVHLVGGYGLEDGFDHRYARHIGISDEDRTAANRWAGHADFLYSSEIRRLIERLPPCIVPMNAFNHPQEVAFKREVCGPEVVGEFDRWVGQQPADRPFFAFVNLVDAHEPYPEVPNGHPVGPLARWYARTPRYYLLAVDGLQRFVPWDSLLAGYFRTLELADLKIGELVGSLRRHGRWSRTLFVVTADHGQSFGEGGNVYHGCGATDSIARVPLLVVPPEEHSVPRRVERWTSLAEVVSWLRSTAMGLAPFDEEGHAPFPHRAAAPEDGAVFCEGAPASDPNRSLQGIRMDQLWNHRLLAAYRERSKWVLDLATRTLYEWDAEADPDHRPPEVFERAEATDRATPIFGGYLAEEADRQRSELSQGEKPMTGLDVRLRSWGYG